MINKKTLRGFPSGLKKKFITIMDNAGKYWSISEDEQLKNLFINSKMDILEISKIHKRSIKAIKSRLIKLNLIEDDFIKKERGNLRSNSTLLLCEIISKHILEQNEKIKLLECKFDGIVTLCEIISKHILEQNEKIKLLECKFDGMATLSDLD